MLLDLKKLFENEEECIPFQFELDLSDTEISGVYPFVSPVQIRVVCKIRTNRLYDGRS